MDAYFDPRSKSGFVYETGIRVRKHEEVPPREKSSPELQQKAVESFQIAISDFDAVLGKPFKQGTQEVWLIKKRAC